MKMQLHHVGGSLGQRERVLYTTWALAFAWGAARHLGWAADDSALTWLLTASGGVIASYTYRKSDAATPTTSTAPTTPTPETPA